MDTFLSASCVFYMFFKPEYILILAFTIVIDYLAGIKIETAQTQKRKKQFLVLSLIANIGIIAVFKYYNFINGNFSYLLKGFALEKSHSLPVYSFTDRALFSYFPGNELYDRSV